MNCIGIDVGGTKIALAKYSLPDFKKLSEERHPTPSAQGLQEVLLEIVKYINELKDKETLCVGIGMPGPINKGCVEKFPNIPGTEHFCFEKALEEKLGVPAKLENDANCFGIGAWKNSEHSKKENIIAITLGTGVGGCLIANGQLVRGRDGAAGEWGHMELRDGQTFEGLVAGRALERRWEASFQESKKGREIVQDALKNDQKSKNFLHKIGKDLGLAISNLIYICNPEAILLGGSAAAAYPFMEASVREVLALQNFPSTVENIPIQNLKTTDAATYGAAWLATQNTKHSV